MPNAHIPRVETDRTPDGATLTGDMEVETEAQRTIRAMAEA